MVTVLSINKIGNRVESYTCTDGNKTIPLSKDMLIKFIKQGVVVNAKLQVYNGQNIIRTKDVPVKQVQKAVQPVQKKVEKPVQRTVEKTVQRTVEKTVQRTAENQAKVEKDKQSVDELYKQQEEARKKEMQARAELERYKLSKKHSIPNFICDFDTKTIEKYTGKDFTVEIPAGFKKIGKNAFAGNMYIRKVILASSISIIEEGAFKGCSNFEEIQFTGDGLTDIGKYALAYTGLKVANLPDSLFDLGSAAFMGCIKLVAVKIPHNVTIIEDDTFNGCINLKTVRWHNDITLIDQRAFLNCNVQGVENRVYLPLKCTYVSEDAFKGNKNMNPVIPSGMLVIETGAFVNTGKADVPKGVHANPGAF